MNAATVFYILGVAGAWSFKPKYIASQYSVPLWQANMVMGKTTNNLWFACFRVKLPFVFSFRSYGDGKCMIVADVMQRNDTPL